MYRLPILIVAALAVIGGVARGVRPQELNASPSAAASRTNPGLQAQESVPRLVQFNGTLRDAAARPVVGVASVTFAIYAEQDGGTALWSETQNVLADANGHFNVLLGSATANGVPAELFGTGQSRWLGVTIAKQAEMPRVLMASVPYALKAADADTLGGLPASAYVTTQSLAANNATTAAKLSGGNTTVIAAPQSASAVAPSGIPQVTPTGSGTTNYIPIWTSSSALGNSTIFESAGKVGIGTTTPAQTLDVDGNAIFRGSFQLPPEDPATVSAGAQSHSFQFEASSYNSSKKAAQNLAFGFRAEPLNNNTSSPSAKLDLFYGPGGGTLTDTGLSFANNGIITFAPGQTFTSTAATFNQIYLPNSSGPNGVLYIGNFSFLANYGGYTNAFVGAYSGSGSVASTATANTAVGYSSMTSLTTGVENTAIGAFSLSSNVTGNDNTAVGENTMPVTTGSQNTALGSFASQTNRTGSNDTLIGFDADTSSSNLLNATAIGARAIVGASNSLVLGGTGSYSVNVGIGTITPRSELDISSAIDSTQGDSQPPSPIVTLTNTYGGNAAQVGIDFNTSAPSTAHAYNPNAEILAVDNGSFSDSIEFFANVPGEPNNGLSSTMSIDPAGNVIINGNLNVGGNLIKGGGSFKIDDPIDPANKYLSHSFVESPDMMNIYNGSVILNAKGEAVVEMPAWFDALNRDFQYQLTAIGAPGPRLYIASEISGNQFKIAGGKKGQKVSWMVTGIRQDAWANAHRIPTEEAKPANEQGHYLHPELFGAGAEKSIASVQSPSAKKTVSQHASEGH